MSLLIGKKTNGINSRPLNGKLIHLIGCKEALAEWIERLAGKHRHEIFESKLVHVPTAEEFEGDRLALGIQDFEAALWKTALIRRTVE